MLLHYSFSLNHVWFLQQQWMDSLLAVFILNVTKVEACVPNGSSCQPPPSLKKKKRNQSHSSSFFNPEVFFSNVKQRTKSINHNISFHFQTVVNVKAAAKALTCCVSI